MVYFDNIRKYFEHELILYPMFPIDFAKPLAHNRSTELFETLKSIFKLGSETTEFIGSHPVNLSKDNIPYLLESDYLVCEKTDGIRLMMFVFEKIIYFYDRKNKFYQTDLIFDTHHLFLFDGEMYKEDQSYVFAIFDTLIYDSASKIDYKLNKRLGYCFEFEKIIKKGFIKRRNDSLFTNFFIIPKQMFKSYAFPQVLESIKTLKHENDGLIFTPVDEPYKLCSRSFILKWKPPHLNTIDFHIKKTIHTGVFELFCTISTDQLSAFEENRNSYSTMIFFDYYIAYNDVDNVTDADNIDEKIGEFSYQTGKYSINMEDLSVRQGGWCLHRIREDKDTPNNIKVVLDTIDSIKESITEEDLNQYRQTMMKNYKEREVKGIS